MTLMFKISFSSHKGDFEQDICYLLSLFFNYIFIMMYIFTCHSFWVIKWYFRAHPVFQLPIQTTSFLYPYVLLRVSIQMKQSTLCRFTFDISRYTCYNNTDNILPPTSTLSTLVGFQKYFSACRIHFKLWQSWLSTFSCHFQFLINCPFVIYVIHLFKFVMQIMSFSPVSLAFSLSCDYQIFISTFTFYIAQIF